MSRILSISSQVVRGYVGNSAVRFVLERLGHEVWALPTVMLSNHPGHPKSAGLRMPVDTLTAMLGALDDNGWLGDVDAVLTGYLPSEAHAAFAEDTIVRLWKQNPDLLVLVDPVLGDDPRGLYVDAAAAAAVRDKLVPIATIVTPNRFELAWLSGQEVTSGATAAEAARSLAPHYVLATSVPGERPEELVNTLIEGDSVWSVRVPQREQVPQGTGDLLAALQLGHMLGSPKLGPLAAEQALGVAIAGVQAVIEAGLDKRSDELDLITTQDQWVSPTALQIDSA